MPGYSYVFWSGHHTKALNESLLPLIPSEILPIIISYVKEPLLNNHFLCLQRNPLNPNQFIIKEDAIAFDEGEEPLYYTFITILCIFTLSVMLICLQISPKYSNYIILICITLICIVLFVYCLLYVLIIAHFNSQIIFDTWTSPFFLLLSLPNAFLTYLRFKL